MPNVTYDTGLLAKTLTYAKKLYAEKGVEDTETYHRIALELIEALVHETVENIDLTLVTGILSQVEQDTSYPPFKFGLAFGSKVGKAIEALKVKESLPVEDQVIELAERLVTQPVELGVIELARRTVSLRNVPKGLTQEELQQRLSDAQTVLNHLGYTHAHLKAQLSQGIERYQKRYLPNQEI